MNEGVRVYVNEQGVTVPAGSSALDAVRQLFSSDADEIAAGRMQLLDSRGLPTEAGLPVTGGSIFRIVPVRDRTAPVAP